MHGTRTLAWLIHTARQDQASRDQPAPELVPQGGAVPEQEVPYAEELHGVVELPHAQVMLVAHVGPGLVSQAGVPGPSHVPEFIHSYKLHPA